MRPPLKEWILYLQVVNTIVYAKFIQLRHVKFLSNSTRILRLCQGLRATREIVGIK